MARPWTEVQAIIIDKATRDEEYRRRLLEDPVRVTEEERGEELPGSVRIRVIESDPQTGYILLPPRPLADELSDAELEEVAGGAGTTSTTLKRGGWDGNHIEIVFRPRRGPR